jgi:hypothetical protein
MTPVLVALAESASWLAAEGMAGDTLLQVPDSWEWLTLVISTCAASCCLQHKRCSSASEPVWVQEEVTLVNEE